MPIPRPSRSSATLAGQGGGAAGSPVGCAHSGQGCPRVRDAPRRERVEQFRLSAIGTCNDNKQIGEYDYVTVDWKP